ncbi:choline transporter [Clostridium botulinum]|uniref:Choline transporter n=1 Tax=Clostridium botulinum C/D str. DC5 TaxID=1443128 RepID=A0A0A0IFA8_CLOBO|nr:BCCT family transporter [Clostridium botulinum]KEI07347.1 choline transporter [Clostridium botulinum C/D str. BKT75002]KEI11430.1 choline transporter [Clostridium botulinum C/D str. BKT2873]KGM95353.1 choline transporter [Clostridium botulinum D str. CCUG 7971]KGM99667.1 choline transporter [Clostridium botulinum C/D str. DC5]KOC47533.1 choline transporter [Clostridium botulinum]
MKEKKDNFIFKSSMFISLCIFIWALFFKEGFSIIINNALEWISNNLSWFYSGLMVSFFVFCIWLFFSKFRNIRLGDDNSKPEFSNISWFAMLFSAGIGIGLVFWGVSEPLMHYLHPLNMNGGTEEAKVFAFKKSFLHWGISAWACYSVLALAIAYMHFRRKKPALISSLLIPLIGEKKAKGTIGKIVDILTIFATISGIVTSLGMGTLQINSGLNYLLGVPETKIIQITIISIITILFLISACTGVKKGIKYLSNLNMFFAILLLVAAIIVGPFKQMVTNLGSGMLNYFLALIGENNNIFLNGSWYKQWTLFYWGWWIAWAPFVAIFIARVSKGRTIKEFIAGVLCVPAGFCIIWFVVFGTIGINVSNSVANLAIQKVETAFFVIFNQYPMGFAISILAVILLFTFFVTSADSATYVLAVIASNGDNNPSNITKIILGIIQSALTIVLLFAGGLQMVQNASILMALPFGIIMLITMIAFRKELRNSEIPAIKFESQKINDKLKNQKYRENVYNIKGTKSRIREIES